MNPITLTMDSDHNLVAVFEPIDFGEPELKSELHVFWDADFTDQTPWVCTKGGKVAAPLFHFIVGYKHQGPPIFFTIDWVMVEELTNAHDVEPIIFGGLYLSLGFPIGCTMRGN
ncbi:MAG: hypothetical protein RMK18_12565, partial [Armatimonadota bacterium]|nr:hypothetical protein [Armatimonadota bacterium]MDW8026677.1 hypothetical protein [Armatimonadota bacterium]